MTNLISRAAKKIRWELLTLLSNGLAKDLVTQAQICRMPGLEKIGSNFGGWIIPTHLIQPGSICYCAGVGEDITFDLSLISRFSCQVYAFDPTPKAKLYVRKHARQVSQFHFFDVGLWDKNEVLKFYAPANPAHVSCSILNLQKTREFFEAPCRRLSAIMLKNGHPKIDLLKLDIEGAEYRVVDSIIEDGLDIGIICVEYDEANHKLDNDYLDRIRRSVTRLCDCGYTLVALEPRCNYTFVNNQLLGLEPAAVMR